MQSARVVTKDLCEQQKNKKSHTKTRKTRSSLPYPTPRHPSPVQHASSLVTHKEFEAAKRQQPNKSPDPPRHRTRFCVSPSVFFFTCFTHENDDRCGGRLYIRSRLYESFRRVQPTNILNFSDTPLLSHRHISPSWTPSQGLEAKFPSASTRKRHNLHLLSLPLSLYTYTKYIPINLSTYLPLSIYPYLYLYLLISF